MSDTSGFQRIEVLESNVGEIKTELSRTRADIEQMMGMMQQLLQAKSADGGQQKEKSGGSGRGDVNDDRDGTGRAPREERVLVQELVPQQQLLPGEVCLATAAERQMGQDLPTTQAGDQRFRLAWVR